jgi:hypothetical protein
METGQEEKYPLPYDLKLKEPIKWGKNETREVLTVQRRLKAKDFKGIPAQNMQMDHFLKMLSRITGEPMALIDELGVEDLFDAVDIINSFLPDGLRTGETD